MKWKRSRKAKELSAPTTSQTDTEKHELDIHGAKPQGDSQSSSFEDEEELEGEEDEKEAIEVLGSLGSVNFIRHGAGRTDNYGAYSGNELEGGGPRTKSEVFS